MYQHYFKLQKLPHECAKFISRLLKLCRKRDRFVILRLTEDGIIGIRMSERSTKFIRF